MSSKKKALEILAKMLAENDEELDQDFIMEALIARERLGSTALEQGIAIPHCRISGCKAPRSALLTLENGIEYGARDGQPVTLMWALIVPEEANETHLKLLAEIAELLSSASTNKQIREATDTSTLFNQLFFEGAAN